MVLPINTACDRNAGNDGMLGESATNYDKTYTASRAVSGHGFVVSQHVASLSAGPQTSTRSIRVSHHK